MRSTDGGQTWQSMLGGMIDTFTGISLSPVNSNVLWAITQEQLNGQYVYRTADGGVSWTAIKLDNTLNPADRVVLADPVNVAAAWASGGGEGLKRNVDGNISYWQSLGTEFHSLAALWSDILYGTARWPVGTASLQVSMNGGRTWSNLGHFEMVGGGALSVVLY